MSSVFNIRNIKLPHFSRTAVILTALVVAVAIGAGVVGWNVYRKLTTTTVTAYFPEVLALYPGGDKVLIMGVQVGKIDSITTDGDKMKVVFHFNSKYKVPENASASVLNPSLVASRVIQLSPPPTPVGRRWPTVRRSRWSATRFRWSTTSCATR